MAGVVLLDTTHTNPLNTIIVSGLLKALRYPLIEPLLWPADFRSGCASRGGQASPTCAAYSSPVFAGKTAMRAAGPATSSAHAKDDGRNAQSAQRNAAYCIEAAISWSFASAR